MTQTYKLRKGLISQKLGSKAQIFDGDKSLLYTLNETASLIFEHLKHGHTKENIIETIQKTYKVDVQQARQDFDELVSDLKLKKILQ